MCFICTAHCLCGAVEALANTVGLGFDSQIGSNVCMNFKYLFLSLGDLKSKSSSSL